MKNQVQKLFINYSDKGGGAEQFTRDLFLNTPNSDMIVANKIDLAAAYTLPRNELATIFRYVDKALQKFTRYKSVHHFLGMHDEYHNTFKRLSKSPAYRQADLVHLNNIHGGWFDLDAIQKIDNEKPIVWSLHDMWCMTGGEAYVFDHKGYQTGDWNTPYLQNYPLNRPFFDRRQRGLHQKKKLYPQLKKTVFVPVSDWLATCLKNSYISHPDMLIRTIKNGVDVNLFKSTGSVSHGQKKSVLFFNNPSPFKGAQMGLEALKNIENHVQILIVGERPAHLARYEYLGKRIDNRTSLAELYNRVDILLFPSLAENMPLTVLEAMACGVVVVANAVGGIPEIIQHAENGFLAKAPQTNNLLDAIKEALDSNLTPVSKRAIEFIHTHHSFQDMLKQYNVLYIEMNDLRYS